MFASLEKSSQALLSDHMPFLVEIGTTSFLGWNMLCRIKFDNQWNYFTSGFACDRDKPETDEQYHARVSHIAAQLGVAHRTAKPSFICLQECPEDDFSRELFISKSLKSLPGYAYENFIDSDKDYFLITFYDQSEYKLFVEFTDEIKAVKLNEGLNDRILPLVFEKKNGEKLLVINVHANFCKEVKNDLAVLEAWAIEKKINMVLLGDFNRDLVKKSDDISKHDISDALSPSQQILDGLHVNAVECSTFISKAVFEANDGERIISDGRTIINKVNTLIETRDGCISSQEATVRCLRDINKTNAYLDVSQLSEDLSQIPKGFIESLTRENQPDSKVELSRTGISFY